ncbi:hypothetical protein IFR05_014949 [Cadophora sp. M221]|nr:hypothetical protein IFR05_014949 [Cadophora sp. M221]
MNAQKEVRRARRKFPDEELSLTHGFYALAGGFARRSQDLFTEEGQEPSGSTEGKHEILWELDLVGYVKLCKEQNFPIITEDDISDRSKSDFFTKTFAIVQSTWLVIQSIARVSAGLPISELELATIAYVLCAIVIYGFWWCKPFDVEHVTIVQGEPTASSTAWRKRPEIITDDIFFLLIFTFDRADKEKSIRTIIVNTIATLFSAIHLAAWNWEFPNPVTRTLWRVFGITSTASGPLVISLTFLGAYSEEVLEMIGSTSLDDMMVIFTVVIVALIVVLYTVSRIALIVLVFYTFSSLPAGVYETIEWATYLPHFS